MASDIVPTEPVHFSRLKKIRLSPAHYLEAEDPSTGSLRKGDGTHSVLLGSKPVVIYSGKRDKRVAKWREFQAEHAGSCILSPKESVDVVGMRKSVEAHPRAMALLDGVRETMIQWEVMGRRCEGTPDVVLPEGLRSMRQGHRLYPACDGKVVVELKTSKTSAPWSFPWEARKYRYKVQCSWYQTGVEKSLAYRAGEVSDVFLVVVESTPPYPVTVFHVDDRALSQARLEWRSWMDRLLECERQRQFPAYTDEDIELSVDGDDGLGLEWGEEAA